MIDPALLGQPSSALGLASSPAPMMGGGLVSPVLGGYGSFFGGMSIRPNTVLSTPDRQAKLGMAFDKMVESAIHGATPAERGEMIATDVFGKLIAPAIGALGGDGTSQAGVSFMQEARQQVQNARAQRRLNQATAFNGLRDLASIINLTSPNSQKALAEEAKIIQKGDKQDKDYSLGLQKIGVAQDANQIKRDANQIKREVATMRDNRLAQRNAIWETHLKNQDTLGKAKLDFDKTKLAQAKEMAEARNTTLKEIAQLYADTKVYGVDEQTKTKVAELTQKAKQQQQAAITAAQKYNASLYKAFGAKDTKGNYKIQDAQGNPLDPRSFLIPLESIKLAPDEFADDPEMQEAITTVDATVLPAAQQTPQQPAQSLLGDRTKMLFQQKVKAGSKPEELRLQLAAKLIQRGMAKNEQEALEMLKREGL